MTRPGLQRGMSIQTIGVLGVGGVGGYFGAKLCRLQGPEGPLKIVFIARGEHLREIRRNGLRLTSEHEGEVVGHPSLATDDFRDLPPLDLCLVCVKAFDLPAALAGLAPGVRDETILLPLLNGVDVHARVREVIHRGVVLPSCVYVGTHVEAPGRVRQKGGACRILFGSDPSRPGFDPRGILGVLHQAGIQATWTADVQSELWRKFIFIAAYGLVSAACGKTLGEITSDEGLKREVRAIMAEAEAVARAAAVGLPEDIVEMSLRKALDFPPEAKTSFQRDFERLDKADERDLLGGTLIRLGKQWRVEMPQTRAVMDLLERRKPWGRAAAPETSAGGAA